jgi:hypothetical protein
MQRYIQIVIFLKYAYIGLRQPELGLYVYSCEVKEWEVRRRGRKEN